MATVTETSASEMVIRAGSETTEYKMAKAAQIWAIIMEVFAALVAIGPAILGALTTMHLDNSWVYTVVGGMLWLAAKVSGKEAVTAYTQSRTSVKNDAAYLAAPELQK